MPKCKFCPKSCRMCQKSIHILRQLGVEACSRKSTKEFLIQNDEETGYKKRIEKKQHWLLGQHFLIKTKVFKKEEKFHKTEKVLEKCRYSLYDKKGHITKDVHAEQILLVLCGKWTIVLKKKTFLFWLMEHVSRRPNFLRIQGAFLICLMRSRFLQYWSKQIRNTSGKRLRINAV